MKKLIVLLVMMCSLAPVLRAADGCNQRLSPAEFRARQKAYITEKAGLTKEEAARFFPLYFELQDKNCLLYTSDAADEEDSVDLGGRRIIKKKIFSSIRRQTR